MFLNPKHLIIRKNDSFLKLLSLPTQQKIEKKKTGKQTSSTNTYILIFFLNHFFREIVQVSFKKCFFFFNEKNVNF